MRDLINKKTREVLCDYFVGTSLRVIRSEFDAADIACDDTHGPEFSGQRRSLVHHYYRTIDWTKWSDVRKFLTVYESVLASLEEPAERGDQWAVDAIEPLKKWIERDGFSYKDGRLSPVRKHLGLEHISDTFGSLDLPELHRQVERMQAAIVEDPGLAIGTAKELVESVCKTILSERQIPYADDADIAVLVKDARKALGLIPESIPTAAKGSESIRRLLSNLGSVAQGLAELRNLYGTGHGKHGNVRGLTPRHARLAVGAAATLATFLFETHIERGI